VSAGVSPYSNGRVSIRDVVDCVGGGPWAAVSRVADLCFERLVAELMVAFEPDPEVPDSPELWAQEKSAVDDQYCVSENPRAGGVRGQAPITKVCHDLPKTTEIFVAPVAVVSRKRQVIAVCRRPWRARGSDDLPRPGLHRNGHGVGEPAGPLLVCSIDRDENAAALVVLGDFADEAVEDRDVLSDCHETSIWHLGDEGNDFLDPKEALRNQGCSEGLKPPASSRLLAV
jgi:hypothetical protein